MCSLETCHCRVTFLSLLFAQRTCVKSLLEFFNLIGGARFPVDSFSVEAMHLNVVNELLDHQGHRSLIVGQTRNLHAKLSGGKLWVELFTGTNISRVRTQRHKSMHTHTQAHKQMHRKHM